MEKIINNSICTIVAYNSKENSTRSGNNHLQHQRNEALERRKRRATDRVSAEERGNRTRAQKKQERNT